MLAAIGARFALQGTYVCAERYGGGHINDTYFATYRHGDVVRRYVHQRINSLVFPNAIAVSENIARVTRHVREKFCAQGLQDVDRRVLHLIPTLDGKDLLTTDEGEHWRTYAYIEGTVPRMQVVCEADAFNAARAFGSFAAALADLPANSLHETIPAFHNTPARFDALVRAIEADPCNRAASAKDEIACALALQPLAPALLDLASNNGLPLRATHNDTKITNVLFDELSGEAICIVDLDTVMPGLTLFDVGELVRTAATRAAEDEPDPDKVKVDPDLFEAVSCGFIAGAGEVCSRAERDAFVTAGQVLAFENGTRFLADHLNGDRYFRVHRPNHNLDRARAQFAIVESLHKQQADLQRRLAAATAV
jgi:Ser/Thr protein kinase RdoA (MazF antagonist)